MDGAAAPSSDAGPGWYPDPSLEADERWWDGASWTDATAGRGARGPWGQLWQRPVVRVVAIVAFAGLWVCGFLTYTGAFDDPAVGHVTEVRSDGDVCLRWDGSTRIRCVDNIGGLELEVGDCVEASLRHGIRLERRIPCPR